MVEDTAPKVMFLNFSFIFKKHTHIFLFLLHYVYLMSLNVHLLEKKIVLILIKDGKVHQLVPSTILYNIAGGN